TLSIGLSLLGFTRTRAGGSDPTGGERELLPRPAPVDEARGSIPTLPIKLGKVPNLHLAPWHPIGESQAKRIKSLIAELATLQRPDFGLSATMSGHAFSPVGSQTHMSLLLLTDHQLKPSATL